MLVDDIKYFVRERKPGRVNHLGLPKPIHPIQIIGYEEKHLREEQTTSPKDHQQRDQKRA
jgi:hypothetical protein